MIFLVSIFSSLSSNINSVDLYRLSPAHLFECMPKSFSLVLFTTPSEWWSAFCFLKYSWSFSYNFHQILYFLRLSLKLLSLALDMDMLILIMFDLLPSFYYALYSLRDLLSRRIIILNVIKLLLSLHYFLNFNNRACVLFSDLSNIDL